MQQLNNVLEEYCVSIEKQISKFNRRSKRGLINVLGTTIKYITGNLDNNDLIEINKNIDSLYKNQEKVIKQMDKYTTFANHLTTRYTRDLETIQININSTKNALKSISNIVEVQLILQYNIYLAQNLLNILLRIERSISLAFASITNLEIISDSELLEMIHHLNLIYHDDELLELDEIHTYKILEFSKFRVLSASNTITCILYIPILNPSLYQYSRIYPIPNLQGNVMIPPNKYHLRGVKNELWTDEKCSVIEKQSLCINQPQNNKCFLGNASECTFAQVDNNYKLYKQLENGHILVSSKIVLNSIEECSNKLYHFELTGNVILSSTNNCKIIIEDHTFVNTFDNFTFSPQLHVNSYKIHAIVNLQQKHLDNFESLKNEAKMLDNNIQLNPVIHFTHFSVTLFLIFVFCVICIMFCVIRKRLFRTISNKKKEDTEQNEGVLS